MWSFYWWRYRLYTQGAWTFLSVLIVMSWKILLWVVLKLLLLLYFMSTFPLGNRCSIFSLLITKPNIFFIPSDAKGSLDSYLCFPLLHLCLLWNYSSITIIHHYVFFLNCDSTKLSELSSLPTFGKIQDFYIFSRKKIKCIC